MAFNNLYSGTERAVPVLAIARTVAPDDGVDATVLWSDDVDAVGGAVTTSPVISWDMGGASPSVLGTKVAFVESVAGSPCSTFTRSLGKLGDGQDTTDPGRPAEHAEAGADHDRLYPLIRWQEAGRPPIWR